MKVYSEAIRLRRLNERQSDFNESLDRLCSKALKSQFPKKMVKDVISRAKGWTERKSPEKSREKGELLVWASGFPHLLKLSQRERSLQPQAMITYKRPPALRDYLTNYKRIANDQHATPEGGSSAPCGHCALCVNYGKHHSMIEKEDYLCTPTGRIKLTQRLSCANYGIYVATCLL